MVDIVALIVAAPGPCTPVSPILQVPDRPVLPSVDGEPGLGVSPGGFLQDIDIQCLIGDQLLEASVLLLELLQTTDLIELHTSVFFTPAVIGLLCHANLSADFSDRHALIDMDFGFPQEVDDLFW